jgi:hypothetical protein
MSIPPEEIPERWDIPAEVVALLLVVVGAAAAALEVNGGCCDERGADIGGF